MTDHAEYDPLDYVNLARSVVRAMLERDAVPLPPVDTFDGSGVYAIYYKGGFELYRPISSARCEIPIYVGKAIPKGGRKGEGEEGKDAKNASLLKRLREHAKSLDQAKNLSREDFLCRYLLVKPVWITLAERFLLTTFRPVWNVVADGFGNHAPGGGRGKGARPRWDTIHPGRDWAEGLPSKYTPKQVTESVRGALENVGNTRRKARRHIDGDRVAELPE